MIHDVGIAVAELGRGLAIEEGCTVRVLEGVAPGALQGVASTNYRIVLVGVAKLLVCVENEVAGNGVVDVETGDGVDFFLGVGSGLGLCRLLACFINGHDGLLVFWLIDVVAFNLVVANSPSVVVWHDHGIGAIFAIEIGTYHIEIAVGEIGHGICPSDVAIHDRSFCALILVEFQLFVVLQEEPEGVESCL